MKKITPHITNHKNYSNLEFYNVSGINFRSINIYNEFKSSMKTNCNHSNLQFYFTIELHCILDTIKQNIIKQNIPNSEVCSKITINDAGNTVMIFNKLNITIKPINANNLNNKISITSHELPKWEIFLNNESSCKV
jgi:hypothetical protein